ACRRKGRLKGVGSPAMDDAERVRRALTTLPIFPLPGAVLLPHALVPLHIFEPRYRKMTRDCEEGLRVLALANIPDDRAAAERPAARAADSGDLADLVAGALIANPRERQAVLEAVEVEPRLELAAQAAAAALARTASNAQAPN